MKVIALGHRQSVGKDTIARFLITQFRLKYPNKVIVKYNFADKLKEVSYDLFNWAGLKEGSFYEHNPVCKSDYLPLIGKTVRQIWIEVGMKMREIYSKVWIDGLLYGIKSDVLIISDLRFPNEVESIKSLDGICIRVDRSIDQSNDVADSALADYDGWDEIISNNSDLNNLYNQAGKILERYYE